MKSAQQANIQIRPLTVLGVLFVSAALTACSHAALPGTPQTSKPQKVANVATVVAEFPIPTPSSGPHGITAGPDGNLWFTENFAGKIAKITTSGSITEFTLPIGFSLPEGITTGPDGNLWFTEESDLANRIGRITPTGMLTEFELPTANSNARGITTGPDGNLWFTGGSG